MSSSYYPSADEIAQLVVAVCTLTFDDPIEVVSTPTNSRSRAYAFHVIRKRYPHLTQAQVGKILGGSEEAARLSFLRAAPHKEWWRRSIFDALMGQAGSIPPVRSKISSRGISLPYVAFHERAEARGIA